MSCNKCGSTIIECEEVTTGLYLIADKYTCLECCYSWLENERRYDNEDEEE